MLHLILTVSYYCLLTEQTLQVPHTTTHTHTHTHTELQYCFPGLGLKQIVYQPNSNYLKMPDTAYL
jgi:hypothetical protein